MTAAVADHKQDPYDSVGRGRAGHVQVDYHAARAVGIDRIGAPLSPCWCEFRRNAVADVISLCEIAVPVENLDTGHNQWDGEVSDAERVFALERRVRAREIVASSRPSRTAQRWQRDRS